MSGCVSPSVPPVLHRPSARGRKTWRSGPVGWCVESPVYCLSPRRLFGRHFHTLACCRRYLGRNNDESSAEYVGRLWFVCVLFPCFISWHRPHQIQVPVLTKYWLILPYPPPFQEDHHKPIKTLSLTTFLEALRDLISGRSSAVPLMQGCLTLSVDAIFTDKLLPLSKHWSMGLTRML